MSWVIDLGIGRHGGSGGKGPARPALSLIPHLSDDSLVSPVNGCRQVLKTDLLLVGLVNVPGITVNRSQRKATACIGFGKFFPVKSSH